MSDQFDHHDQPIRMDELLAELESIQGTSDDEYGHTVRELSDLWKVSRQKVLVLLTEAKAAGRLLVGRKRVERIDGASSWRPCYRLRPPIQNEG